MAEEHAALTPNTGTTHEQLKALKAFLTSEQEDVCSRYQWPREMAREDRQRGLDPHLNKESNPEGDVFFSSAQVADDRDGCHSLDEGSSHFQLNLPNPLWPLCRHQRCSCCPSDGAGPGSSPQDGGASTPEWEMLVAVCPLRWLLISPTPRAENSAARKILPRSIRL